MPSQRLKLPLILAAVALLLVSLIRYQQQSDAAGRLASLLAAPYRVIPSNSVETPANATLGFGAVYVVSGPESPRKQPLLEAAAVSEIDLTIPAQTAWTEEDVASFQIEDRENSKIKSGSIKAWLSHHLVLRDFLASGKETALILEDDVDWDIRLRTQQVPISQRATRTLLNSTGRNEARYPWGSPASWEVLWLGHCGDYFGALGDGVGVGHHHPQNLKKTQHILAEDKTMLWHTDLHPFTASLLTAFNVPEQARVIHRSQWPLCTFGYAVTRESARRILYEIAPAKEDPVTPMTAYDAAMLTGCRDGPLVCYTIQPELFHHMEGASLIAIAEEKERVIHRPPVDAAGLEQAKFRGETSNINCGFWSGEFYFEGDEQKLRHLRQKVGREGQCLKAKYSS
ncbi:hypothetical protein Slin15195_G023730 [Septoria linicola]|uniref:Glycosyltransferase family 25 protein n=1 Tax=Septoria linicola TaxID=215465 RepID=A0A9Q9AGL7_9PEZI|nr:hypothetical protein Slin14017_G022810 [Septoria linicola]USW49054.1 hypothetical protein Slin15195_G023730 [Septoria linicola]